MNDEYILRWISEFGMGEVSPSQISATEWGHNFDWVDASWHGYLKREDNMARFHIRYSLTQKALNKLKEN
jgi:hypothetical protein